MIKVYLVECFWMTEEMEDHWFPAAFADHADATKYCEACQTWIDAYTHEFWEEFARRFGEPRERKHWCLRTGQETADGNDLGFVLAEEWFGYGFLDDGSPDLSDYGRNKMRRLSPDPLVDLSGFAGGACKYNIVEVPYIPSRDATSWWLKRFTAIVDSVGKP